MPTALGLAVLPLSLWWAGRPERLIQLALVASVFEAGAAAALGGFGVPVAMVPALMLLAYVATQYLIGMRYPGEAAALSALLPLFLLLAYALGSALLLPDAFAGRVIVFPQKSDLADPGRPVPLAPGFGNFTQVMYLLINVLLAGAAAVALTRPKVPWGGLLGAYLGSGYLVFALAVWQFGARVAGLPFPSNILYSNPGWAVVEQSVGSVPRVQGPFTEPSALATYMAGVTFCCLWLCLRGHTAMRPQILLGLSILTVLLSTSTTGIATLALGLPAFLLYAMGRADHVRLRRAASSLGMMVLVGVVAFGPLFVVRPEMLDSIDAIVDMTLSKRESDSFNDRQELNSVAWDAVLASSGLGIGWGSTRTSGLLPGLLAGGGVFGLLMVVWQAIRIRRLVQRAEALPDNPAQKVLDGFSAALIGQVLATLLSAPTIASAAFYLQLGAVVAGAVRIMTEAERTRRATSRAGARQEAPGHGATGLALTP